MNKELLEDRKDLDTIDLSIQQLTSEIELKMSKLKGQEHKLNELERTISETEKSYQIVQCWLSR